MNFWRAGTLLSPLQIADSSAVTRGASTGLSTTLSGFVFSTDVMVNVADTAGNKAQHRGGVVHFLHDV